MVKKDKDGTQYKKQTSNDILELYEQMFKFYGWTYWELMSVPIPSFLHNLEALKRRLDKESKAQKKAVKKGKRK